jgi:hypothetical protein
MNQTIPADKGNFRAFKNLRKDASDNRPLFQGKLTLPGLPDERGFALWASVSKTSGETVLSGKALASATAQINEIAKPREVLDPDAAIKIAQDGGKGLTIDPHAILLFANKQKDAEHADRPDYWATTIPAAASG